MSNIKLEVESLLEEISNHDIAYHTNDSPIISDEQYDKLRINLNLIKENHPEIFTGDILKKYNQIGAKTLSIFNKIEHLKPMLSLANAFDKIDIIDFIKKIERFLGLDKNLESISQSIKQGNLFTNIDDSKLQFDIFCELKIDGLSFSARYEKGILIYGATRGDGYKGEDVTSNIKAINNFPQILKGDNIPEIFEVRGEIFMTKNDFIKLNDDNKKENNKIFSNPRNAAAGSLRQLNSNITAKRNLKYFAYSLGEVSNDFKCNSQRELYEKLEEFGFNVEKHSRLYNNISSIINNYTELNNNRFNLEFDVDGIVYKVNSFELQNRLGFIARSPRWAVAHKFSTIKSHTIIHDIILQIGRTGAITPVAILEPVNIGGVIVTRATLHNKDEIEKKDIRIGDYVKIQRAGDVIPQIIEVDYNKRSHNNQSFKFPNYCQICGSEIIKNDNDVVLRCSGKLRCKAQLIETIKHFISKDAFDIVGLGKRQIENFFEEGIITKFDHIFKLERNNNIYQLEKKEGWGEKSAQNLFLAINNKRKIPLDRFIYSIGIRYVGLSNTKLLASYFVNFDSFYNFFIDLSSYNINEVTNNSKYKDIINIDQLGEKVINTIIEYFKDDIAIKMLDELVKELEIIDYKIKSNINQKIIIFTGTLANMSRMEAKKKAEDMNLNVANSISSKIDYVIVGENSGSKLKKAQELKLNIMNEDKWIEFIKTNST